MSGIIRALRYLRFEASHNLIISGPQANSVSLHASTARSFPASPADHFSRGTGACECVVDGIQHGRNRSGDAASPDPFTPIGFFVEGVG